MPRRFGGLKICMHKIIQSDPFLEITLFPKGYNLSISRFLASRYNGFHPKVRVNIDSRSIITGRLKIHPVLSKFSGFLDFLLRIING